MSKRNYLYILKTIILSILFCAAVYFENAQQQRLYILIGVFLLYLIIGIVRIIFFGKDSINYFSSFLIDIALVFIMELNSRLLINYFFHSFYIMILLEACISLSLRKGIAIGVITVLVSLIKYGYLIYYKFNFSNVSQMAFFMMVNILILVIVGFALHNKEEREKKDDLYKELLSTHKQLKQYTDEVNRLNVVEERNRIARDIHDTLGHNMTALIMQLQMAEHLLNEDTSKAKELLLNAMKTAKDSMSGIREVVETLRGSNLSITSVDAIRRLVKEFSERTGAEIIINISGLENIGEENIQKTEINATLFRIIQETMTNAVRHGKADNITIQIDYFAASIHFLVIDDGEGAISLEEGYGLKGIRERIEAFGGYIEYGDLSNSMEFEGHKGFFIKGILYLEEKNDKSIIGR